MRQRDRRSELASARPGAGSRDRGHARAVRRARSALHALLLGMTARAHPELVQRIVERGHERALSRRRPCPGVRSELLRVRGRCSPGLRGHRAVHRQAAGGLPGADVRRERDVPWWPEVLVAQELSLRLEALGHFRDPGARGGYARPAHPGRRPAVGVPDRQLAGWQPVRVPIGGPSYWSLTPTPGLGPQTPHSRRDANVARLNDRRASRENRACRERVLSLLRRL